MAGGDLLGSSTRVDQMDVMRVQTVESTALPSLIARIPIGNRTFGQTSLGQFPYQIAVTPDGGRAYVTMRYGAGVAVVDTMTWQQIDVDPTTGNIIDTIQFKNTPDAQPFDIVISPNGKYAFVSEERDTGGHGTIYVIDIDPTSPTFNKHILTFAIDAAGFGLRGLDITPDGKQLIALAPSVPRYGASSEKQGGKIEILDLPDIATLLKTTPGATETAVMLGNQEFDNRGHHQGAENVDSLRRLAPAIFHGVAHFAGDQRRFLRGQQRRRHRLHARPQLCLRLCPQ